ncbi:tubulin-folding cofactor B-like [Musca vetustissima]|uniref:tubulin-folding cofactor B-like n=1 Tax=Musca vetustissima TaxID=27455 RepID=UPI002AB759B7|nr:tubulin-folding cofactor B-like [Musca vetustissima]
MISLGGSDFIQINVTNSKTDHVAFDIKFPKSLTVADLKQKLQVITGGNAGTMKVELYKGSELVTSLGDDSMMLGALPIEPNMRFHVVDDFILFDLHDGEEVKKFELPEDEYDKKDNTVRSFLKRNQMGKYNEEEQKREEAKRLEKEALEKQKAEQCTVGSRCQVTLKGCPTRRGTVMYNGPLEGKTGVFIGVKYDEPLGKNDGSVQGKRYFTCPPNYGGFVSPLWVEVGDFPEEDFNLEDEI